MPETAKLAVIIPCYNYASYVERAIQSVLCQRRTDCELVVVDDGSTDGSWDVIIRSGVTAFRIENRGQRLACLYGLDKTQAPFVLFLDSDDELKPGALGKIIDRLDPGVAKLQFALTRIDADGNIISAAQPALETFRDSDTLVRQVLKSGVYKTPPTSGNVFRRDLCEIAREATYDKIMDGVILYAAPFLGDIVSVSEELGCYRIHGRNDSGLGRVPEVRILERDLDRFLAMMENLNAIVQRLRPGQSLRAPRELYHVYDRTFCIDIASGKRPRLYALPRLLLKLITEPGSSMKTKFAVATFYFLASVLPNERGKALLAYRFKAGRRTILGYARVIAGGRESASAASLTK